MIRAVRKFIWGLLSPISGVALILESKRVRRLAIVPFILTILVFVVGLATGLPFITGLVAPFTENIVSFVASLFGMKPSSDFAVALSWLLPVLIWPSLALALLYVLILLTRVVAAPFYSMLAERVLIERAGLEGGKFQLIPWARLTFRMTGVSVIKAFLFSIVALVLTVLSFIPGVGVITGFGFVLLIAYDISDYALEARQLGLSDRLAFFRRHFFAFLGLGLGLSLVFLIPGLNFFLLPASVVGAADLVRKLEPIRLDR